MFNIALIPVSERRTLIEIRVQETPLTQPEVDQIISSAMHCAINDYGIYAGSLLEDNPTAQLLSILPEQTFIIAIGYDEDGAYPDIAWGENVKRHLRRIEFSDQLGTLRCFALSDLAAQ
jgi:hypothetical protein